MSKKASDSTPEQKARHKELIGAFFSAYEKQFGGKYVPNPARDFSALKQFIRDAPDVDGDEFVRVARAVWNCNRKWMRESCVTMHMLIFKWAEAFTIAGPKPTALSDGSEAPW